MTYLTYDPVYRRTYFTPETVKSIEAATTGHSRFQLEFTNGRNHQLALYELNQLINLDLLPVRMIRLLAWEGAGLKGEFRLIWEAPESPDGEAAYAEPLQDENPNEIPGWGV